MNQPSLAAQMIARVPTSSPPIKSKDARKEIGLGMSPDQYGSNVDQCLADQCDPRARIEIAEVARWRIDSPVADTTIGGPLGNRISPWQTADGNPPAGITTATNTLATPGIFACDMILRGISIRILVEPEARLIGGMFFNPSGTSELPGFPDVWTLNDIANGALALPEGVTPLPGEFLFGMNTWKSAFAFVNAYELSVGKDHQEELIREPLTQCSHIEPFAEAEAAGMVFGSNIDQINVLNQRLALLGLPQQFAGQYAKRLGSVTVGGANVGIFTPSREQDGSMTMFGAIGVPMSVTRRDPYMFTHPIFWPSGHPLSMFFEVNDQVYQSQFQRWLSVTGGAGGQAGTDLNLPFSNQIAALGGYTGNSPLETGTDIMLEQTLDVTNPVVNVTQQVQVNRALLKLGTMVLEMAVIGLRVSNPQWGPVIARAIKCGVISAPRGYGSLTTYMQ